MSDRDRLSPIDDPHLWEFDDASQHGNLLGLIQDACLVEKLDQEWDEFTCQIAAEAGVVMQGYHQQSAPLEDNGEVITLADPEQSSLIGSNRDRHRTLDQAFLEGMAEFMEHEGLSDTIGFPFSPSHFLQDSHRVEIDTLEKDDQNCPICKSKYGKERRDTAKPASNSDQGLLDEEMPEYPVKLRCGHVLGNGCIKTKLLDQAASCSLCRLQFPTVL